MIDTHPFPVISFDLFLCKTTSMINTNQKGVHLTGILNKHKRKHSIKMLLCYLGRHHAFKFQVGICYLNFRQLKFASNLPFWIHSFYFVSSCLKSFSFNFIFNRGTNIHTVYNSFKIFDACHYTP